MALLTITVLDVANQPIADANVQVWLCDSLGNHLREFTGTGILVGAAQTETDASGNATLDLVPNAQIVRQNTYYHVKVSNRLPVLIEKSSSTQTLSEAQAVSPEALGPAATLGSLGDVDLTGLASGNTLRYQGGLWVPWAWPGGGGSSDKPWVLLTTNTTLVTNDSANHHKVDASAGPRTITLPTAVSNNGIEFKIKRVNTNGNIVTVAAAGGQTIDGVSTYLLDMPWESVSLSSDNSNWLVT